MDNTDNTIRINKFLSDAGLGSRRSVEQYVRDRRVQLDGETVTDLSTRVQPGQQVKVDGRAVHASRSTVVFALNKPPRVLVSEADPDGRPLAIDLVRPFYSGRLFSVGRLDFLSSGLLLFTNDGDLAQALMRPATGVEREYVVETGDPIPDSLLSRFTEGISIEGVGYRAKTYRRHSQRRVSLVLTEGKNREIRRVFTDARIKVKRIYRNRYGSVALGSIPPGEARRLSDQEVRRLQTTAGEAKRRGASRGRRH